MMKRLVIGGLCLAAVSTMPAVAQSPKWVQVGMLDCTAEGNVGLILASRKNATCVYQPSNRALPRDTYVGTVTRYGIDVGATGRTLMQWLVLAPTSARYATGALAGDYVGAGAEATAVIGAGANVLVGGSDKTYSLQPVSIQQQSGVNVAAGVTSFRLQPAARIKTSRKQ
ncbi:DUF992 domain-containing protein [Mesorhizobium sp. 1B3]|uniref:DUF992 domain-containing protein n=1 Tax=Mesorhizobium sp. 1B3 TaxID=3243599 RepID=UPI003D99619A